MNTNSTRDGRRPIAFISHHSSQEQTARHLKNILERNGVEGWMAPDDVEPGRPFDQAIIEEIQACDLIVLLFCSQSDESRHVKRELMMAENHKKLIYPIRLEDIDAKGLAYWLNDYQWIDWIDRRDETIHRLIETIKKQVPGESPLESGSAQVDDGEPVVVDQPPAEPAPAVTAPMALAGTSGETMPMAGPMGLSIATWLVIAAVGGVIAIAVVIALSASGPGAEARTPLLTGNWRTTSEIDGVSVQGGSPEIEAMLRQQIANSRQTSTECFTPEEAADPGGELLAVDDFGDNCQVVSSHFADGRIRVEANCQADDGTTGRLTVNGRYNRMQIVADVLLTANAPFGEVRFEGEIVSERIGDCT
ncbi:MAG: TIR domain-containing protein [Sphingomonadaceae bacterium]|nr:TIR domain-containing protein [Sphingomonadaceae bacterium]